MRQSYNTIARISEVHSTLTMTDNVQPSVAISQHPPLNYVLILFLTMVVDQWCENIVSTSPQFPCPIDVSTNWAKRHKRGHIAVIITKA